MSERSKGYAHDEDAGGRMAGFIHRIKQNIADVRRRAAVRAELAEIDAVGGLDAVLDDIGISRRQMEVVLAGYPDSGRRLSLMAARTGIDLAALDGAIRHDLGLTCALCAESRRCHRAMCSGLPTADILAFCPNRSLFAALRAQPAEARTEPG